MSEKISSPVSLPPGWTIEVRRRKTGIKDRVIEAVGFLIADDDSKHPFTSSLLYFTDPVTGYVFRSFKDVDRYLKTGEVGKLAFKPKDKPHVSPDSGDDKSSSEQKLADGGTEGMIDENQTSELVEGVKEEQKEQISESNGTEGCTSLSEQAIGQSKDGQAISGVNQTEAKGVEQTEGNSKTTSCTVVYDPVKISAAAENQPLKRHRTKRSSGKREPELPRRASKRLAGVKLDLVSEIKGNSRTRRGGRHSAEPETGPGENSGENTSDIVTSEKLTPGENSGEPITSKKLMSGENSGVLVTSEKLTYGENSGELITSEKLPSNAETENMLDEKQIVGKPENHTVLVEPDNKDAAKPESPLNLSLTDLWTDPCIEFAVKTLTGAIPIGDGNTDIVSMREENVDVNKTNENPKSPLDLSFGDLWTDPCIDFAVKTLTGTFPSDGEGELSIQDYFQQNIGSSKTDVDTFCQTEVLSKHFEEPEKPMVAPGLPCTQNVTLQNPGDGGLNQHVEGRSGPRPSVA
ncbi:hypothetical protein LguiA_034551 [Lonicera macranthoides]